MRKEVPAPLSREIPAKIHDELVKTLVAINGGGAIALLTFLGSTWGESTRSMLPHIVAALLIFGAGVVMATSINFVRADAAIEWESWFLEKDEKALARAQKKTKIFRVMSGLSVAFFMIAVVVVAFGAINLTRQM